MPGKFDNAVPNLDTHVGSFVPNGWATYSPVKTIKSVIYAPVHFPFRKLEIKRRLSTTGLYETDWQDITDYVVKWGSFQLGVDDLRVNQFNFSGLNVTVKNDYGEFNPEYDGQSLFYGYFTRFRTLVKLSAGYTDGSGNQFPTNATQGIFIMDANIDVAPANKEVRLNCKSIISPFQETRASEIKGITASISSSEILTLIRDATDGSNNYLFQNFITASAWDIQSTTAIITLFNTQTALDSYSVWELMQKLAEAENFVITSDRNGGIIFKDRLPNDTLSTWSFFGTGFRDPDIISIKNYKEATDKLYTHVRFKYRPEDTSTSFIETGTQTTIDVRSNEWKYGRRTYELENEFFSDLQTARILATRIGQEFGILRNELTVDVLFNPVVEIMDRVDVSHYEYTIPSDANYLWDARRWATNTTTTDGPDIFYWAPETTSTIDFFGKNFKVLSKNTNLDEFKTTFILREV